MDAPEPLRPWRRIVLTLPPETFAALGELARDNYRDLKSEALRILLDGIKRETTAPKAAGRRP
jgi:hypothetical protein